MHQNSLVSGLGPDPLGAYKRSSMVPSNDLAAVMRHFTLEGKGMGMGTGKK